MRPESRSFLCPDGHHALNDPRRARSRCRAAAADSARAGLERLTAATKSLAPAWTWIAWIKGQPLSRPAQRSDPVDDASDPSASSEELDHDRGKRRSPNGIEQFGRYCKSDDHGKRDSTQQQRRDRPCLLHDRLPHLTAAATVSVTYNSTEQPLRTNAPPVVTTHEDCRARDTYSAELSVSEIQNCKADEHHDYSYCCRGQSLSH